MGLPLTPLAEHLGLQLLAAEPVAGGSIHRAWALSCPAGRRLFLKTNRRELLPLFEAEREGLESLAAWAERPLVIPRPLECGVFGDQALLLMEWLPLAQGSSPPAAWWELGRSLARLHLRSLDTAPPGFGWATDNFIGAGQQSNGWGSDWGTFFAERRLGVQFERAAAQGLRFEGVSALLEQVPCWLGGHGAQPSLVHGDLWSGNGGLLEDGRGCLFDPAIHRADREVDLAMAKLFGGFPEPFFAGYETEWPLPAGHQQRVGLYNLYHLLNHANMFGRAYRDQSQRAINSLLCERPGGS